MPRRSEGREEARLLKPQSPKGRREVEGKGLRGGGELHRGMCLGTKEEEHQSWGFLGSEKERKGAGKLPGWAGTSAHPGLWVPPTAPDVGQRGAVRHPPPAFQTRTGRPDAGSSAGFQGAEGATCPQETQS